MSRDDQFRQWAKAVYERLAQNVVSSDKGLSNIEAFKQEQYSILARAGYDLACHVVRNVDPAWENPKLKFIEDTDEIVSDIPDLAELPEEEKG